MKRFAFALCVILLSIATFSIASTPASAALVPLMSQKAATSADRLLHEAQGYGRRHYEDDYDYDDRRRRRRWRRDFSYRDYCYKCYRRCAYGWCPPSCWNWRERCDRSRRRW